MELFSKLQKALIAQSLADTKLNYDKLFATFDFEQSIIYKNYNESLFMCAAITKNHQNIKAEFEEKKKEFIKVIKVILYNDPQSAKMAELAIDKRYP